MKCLNCQTETNNPKFCSQSCAASYNNQLSPKRRPQHHCKNCNCLVNSRHRYCSDTCKNTYRENILLYNKNARRPHYNLTIKKYRLKTKQKYVNYKGGKCCKCGYSKCLAALEFHHTDPIEKSFNLGSRIVKWETAQKELDKCILVCANCHREIENEAI